MAATLETARSPQTARQGNDSLLLFILSVLAGLVDVIGFLRLDHLFTAHITGNLVVLADQVANGGPPHVAQLLSIPVFAVAVAVAFALASRAGISRGRGSLLVGQALLLLLVLCFMPRTPTREPRLMLVSGMLGVAAMAFQNALVRLSLRQSSTTSVMTGNVSNLVIALLSLLWPGLWTRGEAERRLKSSLGLVLGFLAGCAVGAAAATRLGGWAWGVPAFLSLLAIPVGMRVPANPRAALVPQGGSPSR
jgi:uncharacterized membrane protein YoaK (UPF0700 family)